MGVAPVILMHAGDVVEFETADRPTFGAVDPECGYFVEKLSGDRMRVTCVARGWQPPARPEDGAGA